MMRNLFISALGVGCAAMFLSVTLAAQAFAHAKLVSATPAANAMAMPAPWELRLKFSEPIELKSAKVTVTDPKKAVATGPVKLAADDDTVLIVPLTAPM